MTINDKILSAAKELPTEFRQEDLIVTCWQRYPAEFSLGSYSYPDSNRIISSLCGKKGLVFRGFMRRVRPKVFRLTEAGMNHVPIIAKPKAEPQRRYNTTGDIDHEEPVVVERRSGMEEAFIRRLLGTNAYAKMNGNRDELTSKDADEFWVKCDGDRAEATAMKLREVEQLVSYKLSCGLVVTEATVRLLQRVNEYLASRFAKKLSWSA